MKIFSVLYLNNRSFDLVSVPHETVPEITIYRSGSGFYTVAQYREILKVAKEHHVRVIPELDFPAHSMAAIVAMRAR